MSEAQRGSPYQGLIPYDEQDAPFFFGREKETRIITANLFASRLTLLYGASGVGKSSVLQAGVVRQLHERKEVLAVVFNAWQNDPLREFKTAVADASRRAFGPNDPVPDSSSLAEYLADYSARLGGRLFILLDQFEEYFLYHTQQDSQGTFDVEFPRAVNRPGLRVSFLISIREDALAELDRRFKGRIANLFGNRLEVKHLTREAARDAIEKPKDQYNRLLRPEEEPVGIEKELVEEVLEQVKTGQVVIGEGGRGVVKTDAAEPRIETPYLQLVMKRLWEEEMRLGSRVLRLETLSRLGDPEHSGAENIVRAHLDAAMDALSDEDKDVAANVFHYLVTPDVCKIALTANALASYGQKPLIQVTPLLDGLCTSETRILRQVPGPPNQPDKQRYEIFHDVLARAILDWRSRYVRNQEDARKAAELAAAELRAEEQARLARRLLLLSTALMVMGVVAVALMIYAYVQKKHAQVSERAAIQARDQAIESEQAAIQARGQAVSAARAAEVNRDVLAKLLGTLIEKDPKRVLQNLEDALQVFHQDKDVVGEVIALNHIAGFHRFQGASYQWTEKYQPAQQEYKQALTYFQRALQKRGSLGNNPEVATTLNDMGAIYMNQGNYVEATSQFEDARLVLENALGPDHPSVADILFNLAESYRVQGEFAKAKPLYERALEIRQNTLPLDHPSIAQSLNGLAMLYSEQGKFDKAEPRFQKAQEIRAKIQPLNPLILGNTFYGLADLYRRQHKYVESEKYFGLAIKNHKQVENVYQLGVAYDQGGLARLYYDQAEYDKAAPLFMRARMVLENSLGPDHPDLALVISNLASLYLRLGRLDEAGPLFEKALRVQEKLVPYHPDLTETLENYADLLQRKNQQQKATEMKQRARDIHDRHMKEDQEN